VFSICINRTDEPDTTTSSADEKQHTEVKISVSDVDGNQSTPSDSNTGDHHDSNADSKDDKHDAETDEPAVQYGKTGKPLQHSVSGEVFETLLDTVRLLSLKPVLRAEIKKDGAQYLHLRGLTSGVVRGLSQAERIYAQKALQVLVEDSVSEKTLVTGAAQQDDNKAMVRYWRGHVHRLFCDGVGMDSNPSAFSSNAMGRRRTFKQGFADLPSLEAHNRNGVKPIPSSR